MRLTNTLDIQTSVGGLLNGLRQESMVSGQKVILSIPSHNDIGETWYFEGKISKTTDSTFHVMFENSNGEPRVRIFWKNNGMIYGGTDQRGVRCYIDTGRPTVTDEDIRDRRVVLQQLLRGEWVDFATVADRDELNYAYLAVEGKHPSFQGAFRLNLGWWEGNPNYRKPYDLGRIGS